MNTSWVCIRSEPDLWTVGFYDPDGKWQPNSDFNSKEDAEKKCRWLNGGNEDGTSEIAACQATHEAIKISNLRAENILAREDLRQAEIAHLQQVSKIARLCLERDAFKEALRQISVMPELQNAGMGTSSYHAWVIAAQALNLAAERGQQ